MSHVPLTLFYSSVTKLFLLFLLVIWRPSMHSGSKSLYRSRHGDVWADNWLMSSALGLLDEDKLDSEWVVRNLLGGMAAGFGLRGMHWTALQYLKFTDYSLNRISGVRYPSNIHNRDSPMRLGCKDNHGEFRTPLGREG